MHYLYMARRYLTVQSRNVSYLHTMLSMLERVDVIFLSLSLSAAGPLSSR